MWWPGRTRRLVCPGCHERLRPEEVVFLCSFPGCRLRSEPLPGSERNWPGMPLFRAGRAVGYSTHCPVSDHLATKKICPRCWAQIPPDMGRTSTIALAGSTVSGKTCYLAGLVRRISRHLSSSSMYKMSHEWGNQGSKEYLQRLLDDIYHQRTVPELTDKHTTPTLQLLLKFSVQRWWGRLRHGTQGFVSLTLPDPSGEHFGDLEGVYHLHYLARADACIHAVDPLMAHGYRENLRRAGKPAPYIADSAADSLRASIRAIREGTGQFKGKLTRPLAVVLTKCDLEDVFDPDEPRWGDLFRRQGRHYDPERADRLSRAVEQHLENDLGMSDLIALVRQNFTRVAFFAVSAWGASPVQEEVDGLLALRLPSTEPRRVEEPLLWILHQWGYL